MRYQCCEPPPRLIARDSRPVRLHAVANSDHFTPSPRLLFICRRISAEETYEQFIKITPNFHMTLCFLNLNPGMQKFPCWLLLVHYSSFNFIRERQFNCFSLFGAHPLSTPSGYYFCSHYLTFYVSSFRKVITPSTFENVPRLSPKSPVSIFNH